MLGSRPTLDHATGIHGNHCINCHVILTKRTVRMVTQENSRTHSDQRDWFHVEFVERFQWFIPPLTVIHMDVASVLLRTGGQEGLAYCTRLKCQLTWQQREWDHQVKRSNSIETVRTQVSPCLSCLNLFTKNIDNNWRKLYWLTKAHNIKDFEGFIISNSTAELSITTDR